MPKKPTVKLSVENARELFSRVIAEIEGLDVLEFREVSLIESRLKKYSLKENHEIVTWKVFNKGISEEEFSKRKTLDRKKIFYDFVYATRNNKEYGWFQKDYDKIQDTIGHIEFHNKLLERKSNNYSSPKLDIFTMSDWYLFFPDNYKLLCNGVSLREEIGITRSILRFKLCQKVDLFKWHPELGEMVNYSGTFNISENEEIIFVTLTGENSKDDRLDLSFVVPYTNKKDFSLGQVRETNKNIISKNCILERIEGRVKPGLSFFYSKNTTKDRNQDIPDSYWKYLIQKQSSIATYREISNSLQFRQQLGVAEKKLLNLFWFVLLVKQDSPSEQNANHPKKLEISRANLLSDNKKTIILRTLRVKYLPDPINSMREKTYNDLLWSSYSKRNLKKKDLKADAHRQYIRALSDRVLSDKKTIQN